MKRVVFGICVLAMGAVALGPACSTPTDRRLVEEYNAEADWAERMIRDIAVPPVDASGVTANSAGIEFPAYQMRELLRTYLIHEKSYATPRVPWVDARLAAGRDLETDAVLGVVIQQWDLSALAGRGIIYAGARFQVATPKGEVLWTYFCEDLPIPIDGPHGGRSTLANARVAARKLVETALSRLPAK